MITKPWRSGHFKNGYVGEFLPCGQRTWRMVKSGGEPNIFPSRAEAISAAENAYIARLEPTIRATQPVNPERVEAKLADEAENWLRSMREDVQKQTEMHRPGKRAVVVLAGRARA
jgi:hypothetical protein